MIFPTPLAPLLAVLHPHEVKAVGGFARAYILGQEPLPKDIDLAIAATPAQLKALLQPFAPNLAGEAFGSFVVQLPPYTIDLTCLRTDTYLPGSRYPQVQFGVGWAEDASRRDFTIGAIYVASTGAILDPLNALTHLTSGVVQFIDAPITSLSHDPLRWLRFWRFSAQYGLGGYTPQVHAALAQATPALATLSRARVTKEVTKLLTHPHAASVVQLWHQHGWAPLVAARLDNPTLLAQQ